MARAVGLRSAILVDTLPDIEVRGGLVYFTHSHAGHFAMPIDMCHVMHQDLGEALVSHSTRPSAKVLRIKSGKRARH